jgi:hypothetical protein
VAAGAAQLGLDVAGGAPSDDVGRRGLPTARGSDGDLTVFTYNAARLGLDAADGASGDDARQRGRFNYLHLRHGSLRYVATCSFPSSPSRGTCSYAVDAWILLSCTWSDEVGMVGMLWLTLLLGRCIWALGQILVDVDTNPNDRELDLGIISLLPYIFFFNFVWKSSI